MPATPIYQPTPRRAVGRPNKEGIALRHPAGALATDHILGNDRNVDIVATPRRDRKAAVGVIGPELLHVNKPSNSPDFKYLLWPSSAKEAEHLVA
jgi:hypothetical protein